MQNETARRANDERSLEQSTALKVNRPMTTVLRPIVKSFATTLRTSTGQPMRRECWEATTTDGLWAFERIEEPGTPWIVVHFPRTEDAETAFCTFGTLKAARQ